MAEVRYSKFFTNNKSLLLRGQINLETATLKMALIANTYSLNLAHQQFSDLSTHELPTANGYTAGGIAIANRAISGDLLSELVSLSADNPTWTATGTLTACFQVLYAVGTFGGIVNPLISIAYKKDGETYIDYSATGTEFTLILVDGKLLRI